MELCTLENGNRIPIGSWNGQRVVTYDDIANVHSMTRERVKKAISRHIDEMYLNKDYFDLTQEQVKIYMQNKLGGRASSNLKFVPKMRVLTESGYLIIASTFRGTAAAKIRRMLVNTYFNSISLFPHTVPDKEKSSAEPADKTMVTVSEVPVNGQINEKFIRALNCLHKENLALLQTQQEFQTCVLDYMHRIDSYFQITMKNWREAARYVVRVQMQSGQGYTYADCYHELYSEFEKDTGVRLSVRLKNLKEKNPDAKSKLDVIASDRKLIKGFIPVIGAFAMRHRISVDIQPETEDLVTGKEAS